MSMNPMDWSPSSWADDALRMAEDASRRAGALFEPTLRLGVAGLSRSGKTVFITALVAHLLQRGRMTMLQAEADGRIEAAMLRPQPDPAVPRFAYEDHIAAMTGPDPVWPESTSTISELRVSLRFRRTGLLSGLAESVTGPGALHLDIVDYPGEWLLDLPLMRQTYDDWARGALAAARSEARAGVSAAFLEWVARADPDAPYDESFAREGADKFAGYLRAAREAGLSAVAPGRFLMPGDLEGSPALTFAPIEGPRGKTNTLAQLMRDRFEAYKRVVVKPFFRNHFSRLDRQIVLVDALSAVDAGPQAVADLREAMADILQCFRHGEKGWLAPLLGGRIERLAFAATKADHIHHTQHDRLEAILRALVAESVSRAEYNGAEIASFALASVRATVEQTVRENGETLHCVRGRDSETGEEVVAWPGALPEDPALIVEAARRGGAGEGWLDQDYGVMRFRPPVLAGKPGSGPPHLRLDRALEFLIGDRLG